MLEVSLTPDDGSVVIKIKGNQVACIPLRDEVYEQRHRDDNARIYWNATTAKMMGRAGIVPIRRASVTPWTTDVILKMYPDLNIEHARQSDLNMPICVVMGAEEDGDLLIDGWHRIYRACEEGLAELPAYIFGPEHIPYLHLGTLPGSAPSLGAILAAIGNAMRGK